jgi:Iron-containing redox enzyme
MTETLQHFTQQKTIEYQAKASSMTLFQPNFAKNLTPEQKQKFVLSFYHIRGKFYKFLWYLGSLAPNKEYKQVVIDNLWEEFGQTISHEQWYYKFADEFGVDCKQGILEERHNSQWIANYNEEHVRFILTRPFEQVWAIFGAYESLDNIDYNNLYELAQNLGSTKPGLVFFEIHRRAGHFETVSPLLQQIWDKDPQAVMTGFEFIFQHQLQMWERLGEEIVKV